MVEKMGLEAGINHIQRRFGNQSVTLEFTREPVQYRFRSKLEARYANYLERLRELHHILGWWYEPIKLSFPPDGKPPYEWTPDFWVLTDAGQVEIHETKGCVFQKDVHKLRRVRENYPQISHMVMIFAAEDSRKPRVKAAISQWAEIWYAAPLFKKMFGNTKACVQ